MANSYIVDRSTDDTLFTACPTCANRLRLNECFLDSHGKDTTVNRFLWQPAHGMAEWAKMMLRDSQYHCHVHKGPSTYACCLYIMERPELIYRLGMDRLLTQLVSTRMAMVAAMNLEHEQAFRYSDPAAG